MHPSEVKDMAKYICLQAKNRGWLGLQTPYIPYFDSKPPAENNTDDTISELIKLKPSCCPDLTRKGLYISISFT